MQEVLHITKHFLHQNKMETQRKEQITAILKEILSQNSFCFNNEFCQPTKGIAMGSSISGIIAEIFLQCHEDIYIYIKHLPEKRSILFYARYVDDILIIYDQTFIHTDTLIAGLNAVHKNIIFKPTFESNSYISYLDLLLKRKTIILNWTYIERLPLPVRLYIISQTTLQDKSSSI
jgi:hypothetical protein